MPPFQAADVSSDNADPADRDIFWTATCRRDIAFVYRQIIGYLPSNVVTAVVSMAMIYVYTRLLSPAAFGAYSYVFSAVLVLEASLFHARPIAVMR